MASKEVTLRAGDSITLLVDIAGKTFRLNLNLTEHGVTVSHPAEARVEAQLPAMAGASSRGTRHEPARKEPEPAFEAESAVESESSVDIPSDEESSPVEVSEESQGLSESDFSMDEDSVQGEPTEADFTSATQRDASDDVAAETLAGADNLSLTGVPGVEHSDDLTLDEPGFSEQGLTMVPPSRRAAQPEAEPEPLLEAEESAQPLDAVSATLSPVRFHDPATDNLEQPDMEEKRPPSPGPQLKKPMPGARAPQPAAAQPPAEELPPWTGRARDYRDPKLEAKKAATAKLDKSQVQARQQQAPPPPAAEEEPLDLALDEEPAPAPKPAPMPMKKPTAPVRPAPAAPAKPAPMAPKPAPVAAKPAPAPVKPAAPAPKPAAAISAKAPAAPAAKPATKAPEGNFTVFLSPPKGADKKQAAAEIIAEVQGIDINAATQVAGKMIVPVVKGVTEEEANKVRDRLKDAGLSCRITQKR